MSRERISPWLAASAYIFGFAFILHAAIDLFTTVWPMRPTELAWRYGFLGLAAGYLQTPALGLALIVGAAIWREHVLPLRAAGVVGLATAVAYIGIMGIFALDVLAMRQLREPEARAAVLSGGMFQEVKYFVAALVFATMGLGALKTASRLAASHARRPKQPGIVSAAE